MAPRHALSGVPDALAVVVKQVLLPCFLVRAQAGVERVVLANSAMRRLLSEETFPIDEPVERWLPVSLADIGDDAVETTLRSGTGLRVPVVVHAAELSGWPDTYLMAQFELVATVGSARSSALEAIADAAAAMIYLKDIDGKYLLINTFFEQAFGIDRDEIVGMDDYQVMGPEIGLINVENDQRVLTTGRNMLFEEPVPNGDVYVSAKFPLRGPEGRIYAVGGISADITDRTRTEREVRRANMELNEFLSRMSHELRTPLNSILGFGQLLQRDLAEDPGQSENAGRIVRAGEHLLNLINDVLEVSASDHFEQSVPTEPVNVVGIFQEAIDLVRPLADERGIELVRDYHGGLGTWVLAHPRRLVQVLVNVLGNAVKYNRDNGLVTVSFGVESPAVVPGRIRLLITDTGVGIGTDDVDRVFAPFERLSAVGSEVEGTGLGLALSRRLMESMGGKVGVVRSALGRGSEFFVELDVTSVPDAAGSIGVVSSAAFDEGPELAGLRLLYVEDDPENAELVRQAFGGHGGADLRWEMTGESGLAAAFTDLPDLILLDMHLPNMDGEQTLIRLRTNPSTADIPVLALSADAIPTRVERILAAGADDYMTKPIDLNRLITVVLDLVSRTNR